MRFAISLGFADDSFHIHVTLPERDPLIGDVLEEARRILGPTNKYLLNRSERYYGSTVSLIQHPNGPDRLDNSKLASDYQLTDGATLWMICAPIRDQ